MNRYETNSKGTSPALSAILNQFDKMPRSAFDETHKKILDGDPFAIIPIECFQMFPNSEAWLNYDIDCLTKNPTVRRMLSSMRIETRTYYCRNSDLWEGWNNFITKGRSGKLDMTIPSINFIHNTGENGKEVTLLPYNPYSYLNILPALKFDNSQSYEGNQGIHGISESDYDDTGLYKVNFDLDASDVVKSGVSALPAVMYCKIAKEYQNSNLLQDNPYWYPENENHDLILPYTITQGVTTACYDYPYAKYKDVLGTDTLSEISPTNDKTSMPWLNVLYYRQRKGNYFNTGSPFADLLRGDVPTLDVLSASLDFASSVTPAGNTNLERYLTFDNTNETITAGLGNDVDTGNGHMFQVSHFSQSSRDALLSALSKATVNGISFSMAQWRKLATLTVFRERMARTDGSYNQMIQAQFQFNPNWHEHSVIYCGGSSQPLVFSEVVQQSEDGNSPLGTTAGRAFSSSNGNDVHVKSNDFGIFMTVLTITPDDYYSQGLNRMWSELTQSEQYFPILNNLNPQAIKNKELFISGDDNTDDDVFNYQELFSHFKSRQNEISGLMALPISKVGDTGAYVLNRLFDDTPQFNHKFVTGKLTSNESLCFASTEMAQFVLSISSRMKYVAPMPAVTQASDMGLSY